LVLASFVDARCGDTTPQSGGLPCVVENGTCCDCLDTPGMERCIWNVEDKWCQPPLICDDATCVKPPAPVSDQSGGCGAVGMQCCADGVCVGDGLVCASGSCVDIASDLSEQSVCGLEATECCGAYEDCDEGLVCVEKICSTP
jgi:hypothetical protein